MKKTKDAAWENVYDYFDDCIVPECSSSGADILMEGYEEAEIYSCYISGQYSYWYKDSLDGIIQKAKNQNTPGALDNLSKEIQCRYNYKMPADGYVGYTYTGTAKNRNGETNFYLSNDKQTWSTINNICNNWLDEERGMRVDYLDNSCDADYACHLADSVYYYDFRTEKWSTLQSMQLTECPERSNYCDTHSDLATEFKMTCSEAICEPEYQHMECADGRKEGEDGCDCNEDGADCAAVNDPAPDYCGYEKRSCYFPFAAPDYQPSCSEEGEWVVIH